MKRQRYKHHTMNHFSRGFSFLELQVTLVVLAVGLWGFSGLYRVYSRQITYVERYCEPNMYVPAGETQEFWLVSQSDNWMQQLGAPAQISPSSGQSPWTPPIDGNDAGAYSVTTTSGLSKNFDLNRAVVNINVESVD
jgi:hypothetical protein